MKECLEEINKYYVIIVYTASHQSYADCVLDHIDPNRTLIQYRMYRHDCVDVKLSGDTIYVKDLRVIKNVQMKDMIIIDNSVMSFAFQLENGIPILPYYDNPEDTELNFLTNYLKNVAKAEDLREENKARFRMAYFLQTVKEDMEISVIQEYQSNESMENKTILQEEPLFSLKLLSGAGGPVNEQSHEESCSSLDYSSENQGHYDSANRSEKDELGYKSGFSLRSPEPDKRQFNFQESLHYTLDELRNTMLERKTSK